MMTKTNLRNDGFSAFARTTTALALTALIVAALSAVALASPGAGVSAAAPAVRAATVTASAEDTTPPMAFSNVLSEYDGPADITISASDAGAGVANIYYKLDGGTTTVVTAGAASFSTTVHVATNGDHTLEFWSDDAASPVNTSSHVTASFTVNITVADTTPPVTTSDAVSSYSGSATIHLSATDNAGGSGVATTYYKLDSAVSYTAGSVVNVTSAGSHTLMFYSTDHEGNAETAHTVNFTVTSVGPVAIRLSKSPTGASYTLVRRRGSASFDYSATLQTNAGVGIPGRKILLQKSADGVHFTTVKGASMVANANGTVTVHLVFTTTGAGIWRWLFAGDSQYLATSTSKTRITIR